LLTVLLVESRSSDCVVVMRRSSQKRLDHRVAIVGTRICISCLHRQVASRKAERCVCCVDETLTQLNMRQAPTSQPSRRYMGVCARRQVCGKNQQSCRAAGVCAVRNAACRRAERRCMAYEVESSSLGCSSNWQCSDVVRTVSTRSGLSCLDIFCRRPQL
jgi:hypothetical protein